MNETMCTQVNDLVKKVGIFIQTESQKFSETSVEEKSANQLVSYVDKTAEEMLVSELKYIMPQAGFITEEQTITQEKKEYMWVIDPLDGTTNFIHQIPIYSISIALMHNDEVVLGVVYEINSDELFYAWQNSKAYLNGVEIKVSATKELSQTLLATGFPYYDFEQMEAYLVALKYFMQHTRGMRRMGSAAVDLAYVACGRFNGYFEYGLSPWDVAAGVFLVQQAGGKVSDFAGGDDYIFGRTVVASSSNIYPSFFKVIQESFA